MKNKDKKLNRDQKILGLSYLIFSVAFFSALYIIASYTNSYDELIILLLEIKFMFLYMIINLILSFVIGLALITVMRFHKILFHSIIFMAALLVILDIIYTG